MFLQDLFLNRLLSLGSKFSAISRDNIAFQNETFNPGDKSFWIEYTINTGELIWETETQRKAYAVINYVLNVKKNSGTERIFNLASKIAELYINENGMKWSTTQGGVSIFLEELEMLPGIVVNEVFKMNLRLSVCIYNI